ncbi:MAG: choice-of-anchor B family protein [Bacteroidota bacterium]|nr:choice-of-anchor B family protein [Bacteroidota bacterium]MDP3145476.1 choice-of-anchor B family protein [Bacteroidota bacterium]
MKRILFCLVILSSLFSSAQVTYPSQNISLISMLHPNNGTVGIGVDGRRYSGSWGWHQTSLNKEYAIVGASNGTYFIDVTVPATPTICAFVPGKGGCTWREMKTYQNYCYIVSDDAAPNTFQIIDMSTLPSTVTVVHNGTTYFERGHTIWIDQNKMYIGSTTYTTGYESMNVYSLATPTAPVLLRSLSQDIPVITTVHDMYVRNDTVYASCGFQGLYVFKFNSNNTFTQLGTYTGYNGSTYNHASMLTQNGKYLMFCDEVPTALPIQVVNVQNLSNIQPTQTVIPHPNTTPHNPYLIGNNIALVSCYQDGLFIYNIATPGNATIAGFFDTHPQGGFNVSNYFGNDYRGNWGAYPYLPSGIIIAQDMQNGIFILDASAAYSLTTDIKTSSNTKSNFLFYPNPASDVISINYKTQNNSKLELRNSIGQLIFEKHFNGSVSDYLDVSKFSNGSYILSITEKGETINKKLIINH